MRGDDLQQAAMFSYLSTEERVPPEPPVRSIRLMVDAVLKELSPRCDRLYAHTGRPSMAPRATAACAVVASALHRPQRVVAEGTT